MREIKFRGRSIKDGEMVYGVAVSPIIFSLPFKDGVAYIFVCSPELKLSSSGGWIAVDIKTVGQFTGLKGKNGVEIYEGDIIEIAKHHRYVVRYCEGEVYDHEWIGGCFVLNNVFVTFPFYEYVMENGDKIGNIYENPELLEHKL